MTCSPAFGRRKYRYAKQLGKEINVYSKKIVNIDVGDM